MASSKVVMPPSSASTNSDLARQPPTTYSLTIGDLQGDQNKNNTTTNTTTTTTTNFGSMNMDELFRNFYAENPTTNVGVGGGGEIVAPESSNGVAATGGVSLSRQGSYSLPKNACNKTAEEVWKEINATSGGGGGGGSGDERKVVKSGSGDGQFAEMTLEDFLARAGAMGEEDVRIPTVVAPVTGYVIDSPMVVDGRFSQQQIEGGTILGFGSSVEGGRVGGGGGGGRGKRRAVQEPIDKVAQQRQRRMIKNRESAARSRERKQAYTVELETLVTRLEEENAQLLKEQEERSKERYKQLMENLIPVEEKRRPLRPLRRTGSAHW